MCKFLHAAFRHFGDQWSWEDGGNGSGVGGILERLSPTGHNFEGIIAELAEYLQQRDPVEVYTLRDGQRYPEGTWQLTSIGKVRVQDGEPLKKNKCQVNEDVDEWGNCYSSAEGSEGHPWFNTTLFYFSWWWNGVPPELTAKYPELEGSFIDEWVAAAESEHQFGRTPRDFFKLLTGPLARGIGAYNSKFLFSDEYVLGRRRLADCTQYTPVYPNRAHTRAHFGSSRPCPLQTSAGPRQEGKSYSLFNGRCKHLDCPWKHGKPSQNSRRGPSRHSSTRYAARAFLVAFVRRASRAVRVEPLASGRGKFQPTFAS